MSATVSVNELNQLVFPSLHVKNLHQKEMLREKKGVAPHFAVPQSVSVNPFVSSNGWISEKGQLVWRKRVTATNAVSLNFGFEKFNLSSNAKLNIYSADLRQTMRAFTSRDNNSQQALWTPVLLSDDAVIELVIPKNEFAQNSLELVHVGQGFRQFGESTEKSGSCNVDVACKESQGWEKEVNSVAVISTGGYAFCSGFMVNNAHNDKTPYFMTAKHCGINQMNAPTLVVYWNYQTTKCKGSRNGKLSDFQTGATHLASSSKSDFTLVKLNSHPELRWNVNYAGWDRTGADATTAVAIHHPNTDEKSISFEYHGTSITSYLGDAVPGDSTHVKVTNWDVGTTEPGSSGSPLFNQDHRVIGQLHGGYASCSSATPDWYGSLETSWEGDGSKNSRLKDWLDSNNSGIEFVDTI
jgi:V8-like Glu-specific endopeptidase